MDSAELEIDRIINQSLESKQNESNLDNNSVMQNLVSSTDVSEDDNINSDSIKAFNITLHQYLLVDEEIKSLMQAVRSRNEIKRNLSNTLSIFLKSKQIKKVDLDGSYKGKRLEVEVKNNKPAFTREKVTEAILTQIKVEDELFDKIMTAISRNDLIREMYKIKITSEKKPSKSSSKKTFSNKKLDSQSNELAEADNLIGDIP
jgi:hypothetical protein